MTNPWLRIPLEDYERHMAMPAVAQAQLLAGLLVEAFEAHAPRSIAVVGCAGGNGFDRIPPDTRVVAIDINPDYVAATRRRHGDRLARLETWVADIESDDLTFEPVDLVFAALVFEYVQPARVLPKIARALHPGGVLVAVLQLPGAGKPAVTPTPYASLEALAPILRAVAPEDLTRSAAETGFVGESARTVRASGGKDFRVLVLRKDA